MNKFQALSRLAEMSNKYGSLESKFPEEMKPLVISLEEALKKIKDDSTPKQVKEFIVTI